MPIVEITLKKDLIASAGERIIVDTDNQTVVTMPDLIAAYQEQNGAAEKKIIKRNAAHIKDDHTIILNAAAKLGGENVTSAAIRNACRGKLTSNRPGMVGLNINQLHRQKLIIVTNPARGKFTFKLSKAGWNFIGKTPENTK